MSKMITMVGTTLHGPRSLELHGADVACMAMAVIFSVLRILINMCGGGGCGDVRYGGFMSIFWALLSSRMVYVLKV